MHVQLEGEQKDIGLEKHWVIHIGPIYKYYNLMVIWLTTIYNCKIEMIWNYHLQQKFDLDRSP